MTEPSPSRPVPGPPRPGPSSDQPVPPATETRRGDALVEINASEPNATEPNEGPAGFEGAFADLAGRPVTEHVEIFEAEHARLHDELSTIDQL
jgi:hypothetical protein